MQASKCVCLSSPFPTLQLIPGLYWHVPMTYPEFKTLCLAHHQDVNGKCRKFLLDDNYASYSGFTRCTTYPREFTGDTVTLSSLTGDLIVIVYSNSDATSYFAVGLGYHYGQGWAHVDYDRSSPTQEERWADFGRRAYDRMWGAREKHARDMTRRGQEHYGNYFIKHAHLPRSIRAARVVWGRWEREDFKVMVDVVECPGCCDGPCSITTTFNCWNGLAMPGFMSVVHFSYSLELDERLVRAIECSGEQIALGDYGDYFQGNLVPTGNVFDDMRAAGFDLEDSTYCPVVSPVFGSDFAKRMDWMRSHDDLAVVHHTIWETRLALRQPKAISLASKEHVLLLLKASSTRLAGKCLVTTIIQCSDFYSIGEDGKRRGSVNGSEPDSGKPSTEARILTPLCIIACPQVWSREPLRIQRSERLKSIREHFYTLVDVHQPSRTEPFDKSAKRQQKDTAIEFFSDLFGLKYLKNYIGKITYFTRFSSMMETSKLPVGAAEGGLRARPSIKLSFSNSVVRCNPFKGGRPSAAAESDPRLKVVLPLLHKRCQNLCNKYELPRRYAGERQRVEDEIKSISQTLGADLLGHMMITFRKAYHEHGLFSEAARLVSPMKYDSQLNTSSTIQDIKVLQVKLDATMDGDEQRALAEDITGKILWLFWCGICAEVDELFPKVVNYIRREEIIQGLAEIYQINPSPDLGYDQMHLQRIMLDAGANTSKYQLWLDNRLESKPGGQVQTGAPHC
ncbi:hypothetical protein PISMIDRAFT_336565 [Pisolithus microcarpus 441]|uniref:Uncharacterized protein n=1 Tax=Pisolithus microcarpus 441 TaxID=765257 RepID=A0A0C9YET8_9AGAM|nr:hypothetical protein BKA83DRAFT_336565 [Pisolithus microcarpus]KIK15091.1 hypothetical protein PISMIDRAFT_336565 [Pisolithus microcarpus 441]